MNLMNMLKLDSLTNITPFKLSKMYIIIIILAMIILIGLIYYFFVMKKTKSVAFQPVDKESFVNNEAELMFFYADWCPHCKTAKPIWGEIKEENENNLINGHKVQFTEVNCTTESPEIEDLMNKFKIESFPTIKLIKDGEIIEYDAKPNKEIINEFLNNVLK